MFCSKCGKTLPLDGKTCPWCGLEVGESRFPGFAYTSAQKRLHPSDDVPQLMTASYTRSSYMTSTASDDLLDPDARTTYRPAYTGRSMSQEAHDELHQRLHPEEEGATDGEEKPAASADEAAPEADLTEEQLESIRQELEEDGVDLSRYRARTIEPLKKKGITDDVRDILEETEGKKRRDGDTAPRRADYGEYEDEQPEAAAAAPGDEAAPETPDGEEEYEEEPDDEPVRAPFSLKTLLKVLAALVVLAAIVFGGLTWFRHVRGASSSAPIVNVRETFYDAGLEMIKDHAASDTVTAILTDYSASGNDLTTLSASLTNSSSELKALLPDDATENENLYMSALTRIQNNIANCVTSDALALTSNNANAAAESNERWAVVENSIAMLEGARSAEELTAIINGEQIVVAEPSVTATPAPVNYDTLAKGDKSEKVLEMQNRLWELGFLLDDRDGAFGNKTQTAVKMFQQAAGLEVTGVADSATLNAMFAENAPRTAYAQPTATPAPAPTPEPVVAADEPVEGEAAETTETTETANE